MAEFPFLGDRAEPLSVAFNRIASKHPEFAAEHQGVKVLGYFTHGPGMVFNTKKPITKVEDLSGLKFRVGGGMVNEITKTLDMNVTLKPAPDSYELLSSGVMDGTLFPAESTDSFKIDKIIKHATVFPGGLYNTSFVFMMNPAKYNALSAADKKVVDELSGDAVAARFGKSWDRVDDAAMTNMQKNGVKIVKADNGFVSGVTVRVNKLERDWAAAAKAKGLKDPSGALAEFRAEIAKNLDMNVTLKPAPESYELLSTGVMDGTLFPAESTDSFKIDKVIKHATTFPGGLYNTSFVFMMNPAKYNSLSAEDKKAVDELSGDAVASRFGKSWDRVDDIALGNMQKNGVKIVKADAAFISGVTIRVSKLERDWVQAAKAKGVKDPGRILSEFRAEVAKLQKQN
jgi:TRAP-type C4-dicarboxylate transport system substrate-binding protein